MSAATRHPQSDDDDAPGKWQVARRPALILLALLAILAVNVWIAIIGMGALTFSLNLTLAIVSVVLIVLVFMSLDQEPALNRLFAASGGAWILIMFLLMFADYLTRP